jgi:hypothetical protein
MKLLQFFWVHPAKKRKKPKNTKLKTFFDTYNLIRVGASAPELGHGLVQEFCVQVLFWLMDSNSSLLHSAGRWFFYLLYVPLPLSLSHLDLPQFESLSMALRPSVRISNCLRSSSAWGGWVGSFMKRVFFWGGWGVWFTGL